MLIHTLGRGYLSRDRLPIAEAYYKEIPEEYLKEAYARLPEDIRLALESVKKE